MTIWLKNNKVAEIGGVIEDCAECPCDEDPTEFCATGQRLENREYLVTLGPREDGPVPEKFSYNIEAGTTVLAELRPDGISNDGIVIADPSSGFCFWEAYLTTVTCEASNNPVRDIYVEVLKSFATGLRIFYRIQGLRGNSWPSNTTLGPFSSGEFDWPGSSDIDYPYSSCDPDNNQPFNPTDGFTIIPAYTYKITIP